MFANRSAYRVRNLLADRLAGPVADRVSLGLALGNHSAGTVANVLGTLFTNPLASAVSALLGAALGNHLAGSVSAGLLTALGNHLAGSVGAGLLTALRNHLAGSVGAGLAARFANRAANAVGAGLLTALGNHAASGVIDRLAAALGNHAANRVRNGFTDALTLVTNAIDFLGLASRYPALLANGLGWALNAFYPASTRAVYAAALSRVPSPMTWLANGTTNDRTWNLFGSCFPVAAVDGHGAGVVDRLGNVTNNLTGAGLLLRNHDRVIDNTAVLLTDRNHHRVVDDALASFVHRSLDRVINNAAVRFVHRLHDGVVDHLAVRFVHRLHDRVVDHLAVRLVHRLHHGVVDLTRVSLIHRPANVVRYLASVRFIHGLHDRVLARLGLINRRTHCLIDRAVARFSLHASYVDYLVLHHRLILGAGALLGLLFIDRASHSFHDRVSCRYFTATDHTASTILVANGSAVSGVSLTSEGSQRSCNHRYHEQPSHLPFSLENIHAYWMSLWWAPVRPWVKQASIRASRSSQPTQMSFQTNQGCRSSRTLAIGEELPTGMTGGCGENLLLAPDTSTTKQALNRGFGKSRGDGGFGVSRGGVRTIPSNLDDCAGYTWHGSQGFAVGVSVQLV